MAIDTDAICSLSYENNNTELLAIILSIVFGVYILFDSVLGALTVGSKAWAPLVRATPPTTTPNLLGVTQLGSRVGGLA